MSAVNSSIYVAICCHRIEINVFTALVGRVRCGSSYGEGTQW
jgi:hypothetical protein